MNTTQFSHFPDCLQDSIQLKDPSQLTDSNQESLGNFKVLPKEMITEIFKNLDIPDLYQCRNVCRTFAKISNPLLMENRLNELGKFTNTYLSQMIEEARKGFLFITTSPDFSEMDSIRDVEEEALNDLNDLSELALKTFVRWKLEYEKTIINESNFRNPLPTFQVTSNTGMIDRIQNTACYLFSAFLSFFNSNDVLSKL